MITITGFNVIIIGATGFIYAANAGQRGWKVLLYGHNEKSVGKILISGGVSCNFTNLWVQPENFVSQNLHFCKLFHQ
jgi:predicted flavoprotein YhiN